MTSTAPPVPPCDLPAERALLGCILLEREVLFDVAEVVVPSDFYAPAHQAVYEAALELHELGRPTDPITVGDRMHAKGTLDMLGAQRDDLTLLMQEMPGAGRSKHYAEIVRRKSRLRGYAQLARETYEHAMDAVADPDEVEKTLAAALLDLTEDTSGRALSLDPEEWKAWVDRTIEVSETPGAAMGAPWGLDEIDKYTMGFHPEKLYILAARPGMGKSALAIQAAENAARRTGTASCVFSLEMPRHQMVGRLVSSRSSIDSNVLRNGSPLSEGQRHRLYEAARGLQDVPLLFDDSAGLTVQKILSRVRRVALQQSVGLVVIDYLQLLDLERDSKNDNLAQALGKASKALKLMARELKVPVLVLSQLNRGVESRDDKRPRMSDLRDSGAIEQDADAVLLLWRAHYYDRERAEDEAELIVGKNRDGRTGSLPLSWRADLTRFENKLHPVGGELHEVGR